MVHSIGNVHEQELLQRANGSAHTLKLSNPKNMHSMNREKKEKHAANQRKCSINPPILVTYHARDVSDIYIINIIYTTVIAQRHPLCFFNEGITKAISETGIAKNSLIAPLDQRFA